MLGSAARWAENLRSCERASSASIRWRHVAFEQLNYRAMTRIGQHRFRVHVNGKIVVDGRWRKPKKTAQPQ
jgi:hypothetical protein